MCGWIGTIYWKRLLFHPSRGQQIEGTHLARRRAVGRPHRLKVRPWAGGPEHRLRPHSEVIRAVLIQGSLYLLRGIAC